MMPLPIVSGNYIIFNNRYISGYREIPFYADVTGSVFHSQLVFHILHSVAWDSEEFMSSSNSELSSYMSAVCPECSPEHIFLDLLPAPPAHGRYTAFGSQVLIGTDSIILPSRNLGILLGRLPDYPRLQTNIALSVLLYYAKIPFDFKSFVEGGLKGVDIFFPT